MIYKESSLEYIDLSGYSKPGHYDETAYFIIANNCLLRWHNKVSDYPLDVEYTAHLFGLDPDDYKGKDGLLDVESLEKLILERAESGQYGEYVLVEYDNDGYEENCVYLMERKAAEELAASLKEKEEIPLPTEPDLSR